VDVSSAPAVLTDRDGYATWTGDVPDDARVLLGSASSSRWQLEVDGEVADRSKAFGWANAFDPAAGRHGRLGFQTPATRYGLVAVQVLLWLAAIRALLRMRLGPREARS
jgi:hypothetical protein